MNTHDELERALSAALRGRVDHLADAPLTLHDVTGRARSIRRNRRAATGAALLAAAAVIIPVAVFAGGDLRRAEELPATPVPTPVTEPVEIPLDAPVGEAPRIPWIEGRNIHLPDGTTIPAQRRYDAAYVVGGEVLAIWNDDDTGLKTLDAVDASGAVAESTPTRYAPVGNEDGTVLALPLRDGRVELRMESGIRTIDVDLSNALVVSVNGADGCPDGCTVYFNANEVDGGPGRVDLDGTVTPVTPAPLSIWDAHDDRLVTATTSVDEMDPSSCSAVLSGGAIAWETCDHTLHRFSPDGEWVIAGASYEDGAGSPTAAILDAETGTRQVQYDAGNGFVSYRIWEDPTHLLVTHFSYGDSMWRLFRLGLDGSVELAAEPRQGSAVEAYVSPFRLGDL